MIADEDAVTAYDEIARKFPADVRGFAFRLVDEEYTVLDGGTGTPFALGRLKKEYAGVYTDKEIQELYDYAKWAMR